MKKIFFILIVSWSVGCGALEFPGVQPTKAMARMNASKKLYLLENNILAVVWKVEKDGIFLQKIQNKLSNTLYLQEQSPVFVLSSNQTPLEGWVLKGSPKIEKIKPLTKSANTAKLFAGKRIIATLEHRKTGLQVLWSAELRDGSSYIKSNIKIKGTKPISLTHISLNNQIKIPHPKQIGEELGMPVFSDQTFFGLEVPFFENTLQKNLLSQGFSCNLPINKNRGVLFSAVIGIVPEGQIRRGFLFYIDRERARSYSPFLLYNCWFDLERSVSEKGMLNRINAIHNELFEKRNLKVISYVVDDGYDDYNKGFWVFDKTKFPQGFNPLAKRLAQIDSHLGLWLSPAGGYKGSQQRKERAKELGISKLDLSTPAYYKWFLARHMRFVKEEQVNYFKWDRLGEGVSGHFMALMDIAHQLRSVNPNMFLATTVGTWPSPFWLNHVDCTWRGGQDMGFEGAGDNREKWLNYRDGTSYECLKKSDFIFPLNALMNHGIVFANGHPFPKKALQGTKDLRNETRSYFGGGYAMQELYITPDILKKEQWDAIAEAAKWAHKNSATLVDAHFIGGNPLEGDVYGFAAWNANRGTLTLRNPSDQPQTYTLNIADAFELPQKAIQKYKLVSPFTDQKTQTLFARAGAKTTLKLNPFEVLVFDALPQK